ncbi:MAG: hypothetical protein IPH20_21525 [Bacteroidales bacterium]|nr:hypothetical protein [Bacteroidales bacterium]
MKNIRFLFDDQYGGTYAALKMGQLKLHNGPDRPGNSVFDIDEVTIEKLMADVLISKASQSTESTGNTLPKIAANKIEISDARISYGDSVIRQSVVAAVNRLGLNSFAIDLNTQTVSSAKVILSTSEVSYKTIENKPVPEAPVITGFAPAGSSDWKVSVGRIELDDNLPWHTSRKYACIENVFDVNHLNCSNLTLKANDFYYSPQN